MGANRFKEDLLFKCMVWVDITENLVSSSTEAEQAKEGAVVSSPVIVETPDELTQILLELTKLDIVEKISNGEFKFSHDHVREAASTLLPEGPVRTALHYKLGQKVLRLIHENSSQDSSIEEEDKLILIAVNQLNRGAALIENDSERLDLAELNYRAGQYARRKAAFEKAVEFLETSKRHLGPDLWESEHYKVTNDLMCELARVYYCCGRQEDSYRLSVEVFARARIPRDRRRASRIIIKNLIQKGKSKEACDIVLSELRALGVYYPAHFQKFHRWALKHRITRILKGKSDEDLLAASEDVGEELNYIVIFLTALLDLFQRLGQAEQAELAELMLVVITLEFNIGNRLSWVYAIWGALLSKSRNFNEAYRFGKLALQANEMVDTHVDDRDISTVIFVHSYIFCWVRPYQESLDPLLRAAESIIRLGRVDEIKNGFFYISTYFCSGLRLGPLEQDVTRLVESLDSHGLEAAHISIAPLHQMILNLTGNDDTINRNEPTELDGKAMKRGKMSGWVPRIRVVFCRLVLAYLFMDLETAEHLSDIFWTSGRATASIWEAERTFFEGMTYLSLSASAASRKKYRKRSKIIVSCVESWVRNGAINCFHKLQIMRAEQAAGSGDAVRSVQSKFDEAIASSAKLGFLYHQVGTYNALAPRFFFFAKTDKRHELGIKISQTFFFLILRFKPTQTGFGEREGGRLLPTPGGRRVGIDIPDAGQGAVLSLGSTGQGSAHGEDVRMFPGSARASRRRERRELAEGDFEVVRVASQQ